MVDPKDNNEKNKELVEALKTEYDDEEVVAESKSNNVFGFKLKKVLIVLILIVILLIIVLWLLSVDSSKTTNSNKGKLLYNELISQNNIVTNDAGLYQVNNQYVFRGETVNNYVKFSNRIWRIVKIDSNNDIVLILDNYFSFMHNWDDRYNENTNYNSGYNEYSKSRIKDFFNDMYNDSLNSKESNKNVLLTKSSVKKIVDYNLCVDKASVNQELKNNYGCSVTLNNVKIGLLTLSDYINASLDSSCKNSDSRSCQNYNYLAKKSGSWWLATANSENNTDVYMVASRGRIFTSKASRIAYIRPVIHLSKNIKYTSGNGTENKPYVIE